MSDHDDEDDADESGPSEEEVRAALRSLRGGSEPALDDIMTLVNAGSGYSVPDFDEELAECVIEHVLDRVNELPDPDGELPRKSQ